MLFINKRGGQDQVKLFSNMCSKNVECHFLFIFYSECLLFIIVNWFFFLALDEGGSSSNIFSYQLVKSSVAKVHTS